MKTVVLGFDALDSRYLDRFAGDLPAFSRLRDEGVEASLKSTHPPWTASAWPSMYTGTDPSHHGVSGFFAYDTYPDDGTLVTRADVDRPAIWDYLSVARDRSIVLNVPITHPADPIHGVLIPGYLASEREPGHPPEIRDELEAFTGESYRIYSRNEVEESTDEKLTGYVDLIDGRRRAATTLLEREEWSFAAIQVQKTDAVFHNFEDDAAFRAVYRAADRLLGNVLNLIDDDTTVIVCSDHGMRPIDGYQIHVNQILADHGLLASTAVDETPTLETVKDGLLDSNPSAEGERSAGGGRTGEDGRTKASGRSVGERTANGGEQTADSGEQTADSGERTTGIERRADDGGQPADRVHAAASSALGAVGRLAPRVGLTPERAYDLATRIGVEERLVDLAPDELAKGARRHPDWRRSAAYCPDSTRMGVRINLVGREPEGVVSPEAYESVRSTVIDLLSSLKTPDGRRAFEYVCRREEVYDGPAIERTPDVYFLPRSMAHRVSTTLYGPQFLPASGYDHALDGVFLASGPVIDDDCPLDRLSLTDVAPIAMASLGRAVPERMTGTAPGTLLDRSVTRSDYGDVPYASAEPETTSAVDEDRVTARLEDLGYL